MDKSKAVWLVRGCPCLLEVYTYLLCIDRYKANLQVKLESNLKLKI